MRTMNNHKMILLVLLVLSFLPGHIFAIRRLPTTMLRPPRLTVVIVVDAMGYHYMQKLLPYFNYGIKTLLDKGVVYTNAYWPHGTPSTGPGHAGLNTGVYGKDNGIVCNSWIDCQGNKIECDDDSADHAAVIGQSGLYNY
ncbi:MAG TPA: alkaline phosphatase family protein, partial [Candidatus Dependentiae bacterium]|nr:alkaline phosphatase family protein [Candidatus Dependentiae bacterium]